MIKVFLREKKLRHGKRGLYLDYYPPIGHLETQEQTRREHFRLYIYEKPETEIEKDLNKETWMLGENIRSKRQLELQAGIYGFISARSKLGDFLAFYRQIVESKKRISASKYNVWLAALHQLEKFTNKTCQFNDVTESFCIDFKNYLLDRLSINTASVYFNRRRAQ
jgi:hypothetical protein